MDRRVRLDPGSISVASFDTSREERGVELFLITRSTVNVCCIDTVCATRAECSTETCTTG